MASLAYFLTWTCKGTWLHGDARRSVDKLHNTRGAPRVEPSIERETRARERMDRVPFLLSDEARTIVGNTIRAHCQHRSWTLHALNVRTNHVHVVVDCNESCSPERVMEEFKAWAIRRLRAAGLIGADEKPWTSHGSTRWVKSRFSLERAIQYVKDMQ